MKIAVGCDHGGLEHKNAIAEHLKSEGFEVEDFGIYENKSVDYPEIALKVANSIKNGENELGILVCGTGIGMSLVAIILEHHNAVLSVESEPGCGTTMRIVLPW